MKTIKKYIRLLTMAALLTACAAPQSSEPNSTDPVIKQEDNKGANENTYEYLGETSAQNNDRSFTLEDIPENICEELIADQYYYEIMGETEKMSELYGDNEALKIAAANVKTAVDEGNYIKDYILHDLTVIADDELDEMLAKQIDEATALYELTESVIVKADIDLVWSESAEAPQIGNGRYPRIFLCGKQKGEDSFKIYELYWGEMFGY